MNTGLLKLSVLLVGGETLFFDVHPEVGYHVLQEARQGAEKIHFEDFQEKPVTLSKDTLKNLALHTVLHQGRAGYRQVICQKRSNSRQHPLSREADRESLKLLGHAS